MARTRKRESRRSRLHWIVTVLVLAVVAFCALSSWEDKTGNDLGLPSIELPSLDFITDIFEEFTAGDDDMDNAVAVSSSLPGAELEVHILDMGQADSILIIAPKKTVLIDAGENNQGEEVIRYLGSQGVRSLDYVIGTHPHSDHIGGLDTVIQKMDVNSVILPTIPEEIMPTTQTYTDLLLAIGEKGLKITAAKPGRELELGDGAKLTLQGPVGEYSDLNNMSVVSRLSYGRCSFLFTGDIETGAENDLLRAGAHLSADVLDIGHHGSNTSTSDDFLDRVSPRIALISCGIDNSYGHPHRETIEKLEARDIRILRTDLNGAIVLACDGERIAPATEK